MTQHDEIEAGREVRTDRQREWADWAASGYAERLQPGSIPRFGFAVSLVLVGVGLLTVCWLAAHGRLP